MSYCIDYNSKSGNIYRMTSSKKRIGLVAGLVLAIALFMLLKLDKNQTIKSWLIPGDAQVTENAFSEMIENIREGETIGGAVTTFCREILKNDET